MEGIGERGTDAYRLLMIDEGNVRLNPDFEPMGDGCLLMAMILL